ncbi:MAG: hypothetical protein ITF98_03405 [Fermentimonas sp.]|nr:hypothetical protein [Fermentimonas sp.]
MSENRNTYIDKLLSELKFLENSVLEIKNSDSMPFSFFRESFERTQEISQLLHKLEFVQVDDMKKQMEKLVFFLSESEKKGKTQEIELEKAREIERELAKGIEKEKQKERELAKDLVKEKQREIELANDLEKEPVKEADEIYTPEVIEPVNVDDQAPLRNVYAEGFVLPEYRNPLPPEEVFQKSNISGPMHIIDIKRGVSLNDRFLFQRELFNNNRNEMNNILEQLNSFESYEEAEKYLRDNNNWDFENQIVNDFLLVVRKGFK